MDIMAGSTGTFVIIRINQFEVMIGFNNISLFLMAFLTKKRLRC
jgi:hypothetical protein